MLEMYLLQGYRITFLCENDSFRGNCFHNYDYTAFYNEFFDLNV